jgi:hypothetical protein
MLWIAANVTTLHHAAENGHVEVVKVLLQNGADVNAVDCEKKSALRLATFLDPYSRYRLRNPLSGNHVRCILHLLIFGAEIDESAITSDASGLLRPIKDRLNLLRKGERIGTSLLSNEERRFMWNLAFSFTCKHSVVAFKVYYKVRSFITFHGMFMGSGYDLGDKSFWRVRAHYEYSAIWK